MDILKNIGKLAWETYGPFFPMSKRKKEEFLNKIREKVAFYKPRIEERCKIDLGEVKVKDNREWSSDMMYYQTYEEALKNASKRGKAPSFIDFNICFSMALFARTILAVPIGLYNHVLSNAQLRVLDDSIYVPFYPINRFMDVDFERRTELLDNATVHELSHILWNKLSPNEGGKFMERRRWFEGFAVYCSNNYFADFYLIGTKILTSLPRTYTEGARKVEEVVGRYGTEILFDIPKRWEEFSKKTN